MDNLVLAAAAVATAAHKGQVDKAGQPYIGHPIRVASFIDPDDVAGKVVAYLHDVVEDTAVTLDDLAVYGFEAYIIDAVDAITRRRPETPADYYARVRANPIALRVKIADIGDNTDPQRLFALDPSTRNRLLRKYGHALVALGTEQ